MRFELALGVIDTDWIDSCKSNYHTIMTTITLKIRQPKNVKVVVLFVVIYSIPGVIKQYGSHLKASAAMVRLRLYDVLSLLPPETFEGRFISTYID